MQKSLHSLNALPWSKMETLSIQTFKTSHDFLEDAKKTIKSIYSPEVIEVNKFAVNAKKQLEGNPLINETMGGIIKDVNYEEDFFNEKLHKVSQPIKKDSDSTKIEKSKHSKKNDEQNLLVVQIPVSSHRTLENDTIDLTSLTSHRTEEKLRQEVNQQLSANAFKATLPRGDCAKTIENVPGSCTSIGNGPSSPLEEVSPIGFPIQKMVAKVQTQPYHQPTNSLTKQTPISNKHSRKSTEVKDPLKNLEAKVREDLERSLSRQAHKKEEEASEKLVNKIDFKLKGKKTGSPIGTPQQKLRDSPVSLAQESKILSKLANNAMARAKPESRVPDNLQHRSKADKN